MKGGGHERKLGKAERKYLERHAEPEAALAQEISERLPRPFGHIVVIPCYGEGRGVERVLESMPAGRRGDVLTIVVVNQRGDAPAWAQASNRETLDALRSSRPMLQRISQHVEWLEDSRGALMLIDRTRPENLLPEGQGVGIARKIGCDLALAIWLRGGLASPWIHCTDADASLPGDFFSRIEEASNAPDSRAPPAAYLYDFEHSLDVVPEHRAAALRYEIFLRYYVLGLRSAGSPYAHHSIGSTITLDPLAYARVRGFPRRLAGEDFHLLNKLAKLGAIESLRGEPIQLSQRISQRVPFGTGAALARQADRDREGIEFVAYDPRVFAHLGVWLETLNEVANRPTDERGRALIESVLEQRAEEEAGVEFELLRSCLHEIAAFDAAGALLDREGKHALLMRQLHERFDGLATLKLIHALRDRGLASLPLEEALVRAPFLDIDPSRVRDLPELRSTLALREGAAASLRRPS